VVESASPSAKPVDKPLARYSGQCVEATGYAIGAKIGPQLLTSEGALWLAPKGGDTEWQKLPSGARVRVRGVVRERSDLPVFIQPEEGLVSQGMPMPEGTDLDAAARRWVIESATITLLRTTEEVERELSEEVGRTVTVAGVVWSRNDHWWMSHDGVEVHLLHREAIADWTKMHGRALALSGVLVKKPMPRLDQVLVLAHPELRAAFALEIEKLEAHPSWKLERCPASP